MKRAIFISGGASGIGLATAHRFARDGWFVGLGDIDEAGLAAAAEALGDAAWTTPLDVRDRKQWKVAIEGFVKAAGGRLDILVNNAGIARYGFFEEVSPDEADLQIDINVKGVINGAYAALDALRATPGSRLINVASCAGLYGSAGLAVYSATKFAVRGLSEALDIEFSRFGVDVACVMPWFVETAILDSGSTGSNRTIRDVIGAGGHAIYTVEEAADTVWRAAHGRDLHYIVGAAGRELRANVRIRPRQLRAGMRAAITT